LSKRVDQSFFFYLSRSESARSTAISLAHRVVADLHLISSHVSIVARAIVAHVSANRHTLTIAIVIVISLAHSTIIIIASIVGQVVLVALSRVVTAGLVSSILV
jgi:hypothetical protein